jgi:peptide deformylase
MTASAQDMEDAGILQRGHPLLEKKSAPYRLPPEAQAATKDIFLLGQALGRVSRLHSFPKGCGIAAPQIGIGRRVIAVVPPGGPLLVMLNPVVMNGWAEEDDQYEGCLSFFSVRGKVSRPLWVAVRYTDISGEGHTETFEKAAARLICHEIDHLEGLLYPSRMERGEALVPAAEAPGHGEPWLY